MARELQKALPDSEVKSITDALWEERPVVNAECVGFVFPMHYFGLPIQVEEFLQKLTILESPYIFVIVTCGVPYWGRPFMDAEKILKEKNRSLHASWYVRLVSNYIPYRDIAAEWRISIRAWLARRKLKNIANVINKREAHTTWQLLKNFCGRYHDKWLAGQKKIDNNFLCDKDKCTACGMCERICPRENIKRPEGQPVWQHKCVECLGCLHICPVKAIDYGEITRSRKRYRHSEVKPAELLRKS